MDNLIDSNELFNIIKLYDIPNIAWKEKYDNIVSCPYIKQKYNRNKRIEDKSKYISDLLPEIKNNNGLIIDVGPGPGEFLEICRYYGNDILGIDAKLNDCEMGDEYIILSLLMTERQKIPVKYIGFENLLEDKLPFDNNSVSVINFQGSINQVFKKYFIGEKIKDIKDESKIELIIDDNLKLCFLKLFSEVKRVLKNSGIFLIFSNKIKNTNDYDHLIKENILLNDFKLCEFPISYNSYKDRLHKIVKIG